MPDTLSKEQRSYCMSRIKAKNTRIELMLRKELHRRGLRYQVHYSELPGKPDIVFTKQKLAVFVDGDFWHGRNFDERKNTYKEYWFNKIHRNMKRDRLVDKQLAENKWRVMRIWGSNLKSNLKQHADEIEWIVKNCSTL